MSDTRPEAAQVQTKLLRRATPAQHFAMTRSLSEMAMWHAWRVTAQNNPAADEAELTYEYIVTYYGRELADRLRPQITSRLKRDA